MTLSNVTKQKFREMSAILIFFFIIGILGTLVSLRSEDFPIGRGMIALIIFGILTAIHEIVISPKIKKFNFVINFITSAVYYYVTFSVVIIFMGYATQVYKHDKTWSEALTINYYSIFPDGIGQPMLILGMAVILVSMIRFSNVMLGQGVLFKYISGRYHRPRSEKRIFMFLDLKSSTEIAEKLGHEKYSNFLKDFFNKIDEAILETKGFLFQFVGDEIVMIWGYKKGFENNNILQFYKMIKEVIKNSKEEFLKNYGIIPEYKAGIHCGTVSITEIGSIRKSIAYHGDPINTAARVCAKCKELDEELLITGDVFEKITNLEKNSIKYLGEFIFKGKREEIPIYSVK